MCNDCPAPLIELFLNIALAGGVARVEFVGVFSASFPPPVLYADGVWWWAWFGTGGVCWWTGDGGRKLT